MSKELFFTYLEIVFLIKYQFFGYINGKQGKNWLKFLCSLSRSEPAFYITPLPGVRLLTPHLHQQEQREHLWNEGCPTAGSMEALKLLWRWQDSEGTEASAWLRVTRQGIPNPEIVRCKSMSILKSYHMICSIYKWILCIYMHTLCIYLFNWYFIYNRMHIKRLSKWH